MTNIVSETEAAFAMPYYVKKLIVQVWDYIENALIIG